MKYLFITSVPSFYKEKLFSELSKTQNVTVIYTYQSNITRNVNFFTFEIKNSIFLNNIGFFKRFITIYRLIHTSDIVILGGWDDIYCWYTRLFFKKKNIRLILESSIYEYKPNYFKYLIKKYFLLGVKTVIASGIPQLNLLNLLKYKRKINLSFSVGLLDFEYPPISRTSNIIPKSFLFIGRVCSAKGIDLLIESFTKYKNLTLNIVGEIEDKKYLKKFQEIKNINYLGYKNRSEFKNLFSQNDILLLPSKIEPWGLVIEEAIYHGLPVICSNKVGCNIDIVKKFKVGLIFDSDSILEFNKCIDKIIKPYNFNSLKKNINKINFNDKNSHYINSFL
jgi:glycosyltransferase involved in cell wall biosynthesis